jgi:hypothetical protein
MPTIGRRQQPHGRFQMHRMAEEASLSHLRRIAEESPALADSVESAVHNHHATINDRNETRIVECEDMEQYRNQLDDGQYETSG